MPDEKTIISISAPAPKWTTWVFRSFYLLNIALTFWISGTRLIAEENKLEVVLGLRVLDLIAWGIGRGLGVKKQDFEEGEAAT